MISSTRESPFVCKTMHAQSEVLLLNLAETSNLMWLNQVCQHWMLTQSTQLQSKYLEIGTVHNHAETIKVLWWVAALRTPLGGDTLVHHPCAHFSPGLPKLGGFLFKVCSAHLLIFTLLEHFLGELMNCLWCLKMSIVVKVLTKFCQTHLYHILNVYCTWYAALYSQFPITSCSWSTW